MKFTAREYLSGEGRSPFREWLDSLDLQLRARVQARVLRFEVGNLGDHKSVGQGVLEARLAFGAGYRIYFGKYAPPRFCSFWAATRDPRRRMSGWPKGTGPIFWRR